MGHTHTRLFPARGRALLPAIAAAVVCILAAPRQAAAQDRYKGEPAPRVIHLTPADLQLLKTTVPNGENITEEQVIERLRQLKPVKGRPRVILHEPARPAVELTLAKLREMIIEGGGTELSTLRLRLLQDNKPLRSGRTEFKEAKIDRVEESVLYLTPARGRGSIAVDFTLTPGLDLRGIGARAVVRGALYLEPTPVGEVMGVALSDATGPLFIAESRLLANGLKDEDLGPFRLNQRKGDLGDPSYVTDCMKVYFLDVAVSIEGEKKPVLIGHGQQKVIRHAKAAYLVTIVRSQHNEEVPCENSFEEAPWVLEYTIRRVDDEKELKALESVDEPARDEKALRDDPKPGVTGDGPPDRKKQKDGPPKPESDRPPRP